MSGKRSIQATGVPESVQPPPQWLWPTVIGISAGLLSCAGCLAGTTGFSRPLDPAVELSITNVLVGFKDSVAPALPQPLSSAAELGTGLILAALAAWQTWTYAHVRTLRQSAANALPNHKL